MHNTVAFIAIYDSISMYLEMKQQQQKGDQNGLIYVKPPTLHFYKILRKRNHPYWADQTCTHFNGTRSVVFLLSNTMLLSFILTNTFILKCFDTY